MKIDAFKNCYKITAQQPANKALNVYPDELSWFLNNYGGCTFENGLFRVLNSSNLEKYNRLLISIFPNYLNKIIPFSFDWLGRFFAIENTLKKQEILILEAGHGEVLRIPVNIKDFLNDELVNFKNEALALNFYVEWQKHNDFKNIAYDECVGYKTPLFLGGEDNIKNLEITNLELYLDICGQLMNEIKNLPVGTIIDKVTISDYKVKKSR